MRQQISRHNGQHIRLVFGGISGSTQGEAAGRFRGDACIVARADRIETKVERTVEDGCEFDPLVAAHTWVGGTSGGVFGEKVVNDLLLKLFSEIPDIKRDTDGVRGAAGVSSVGERATTPRAIALGSRIS